MKIYVSATYRDLAKHRAAVSTVLRRLGHQVLGMEEYVAEGVRPLNRCLADVDACDAYVGILAWRYGFVPTSAGDDDIALPPQTTLGTTSITEFEFRQAVATGRPVLMFLLDPDADWPSTQFDAVTGDGEGGHAIAQFRQLVGEQYLVGSFRSPEDLAALVSAAVYRVEMSRQMSLESLQIEARFNQAPVRQNRLRDTTLKTIHRIVAESQEAQALKIDLGGGRTWWMTRLYFLCSLASDLTAIEAVVFVSEDGAFVGTSNPEIVKDRLVMQHPALERYERALATGRQAKSQELAAEIDRRVAVWEREMTAPDGEYASPVFASAAALARWLGPYLIAQAIEWAPDGNASLQMQRLLDWPMRFVPVVEDGRFARIVDKQALTEQVARLFVREQVSRALSTTR